jgi:Skp family chaperone for outer membrane proteins
MKTLPILLAFAAASVSAAAPNVGVVDVAEVMAKYNKAIEIKGGIDQSLAQSKAQVEQKGKELEALKADFDKTVKDANNPMLNESGKKAAVGEAQAKQQNLQQRFSEYQQFVQQAQGSIQARAGELEKAVLADVKTAAEKVAKIEAKATAKVAQIAARLQAVLNDIAAIPTEVEVSTADDLARKRADRIAAAAGGAPAAEQA